MQETIASLQKKLRRKQIEMNSIQQIGKSLSSELRTARLLPLIMTEVTRLMHAERSTFYIVDQERGELWSQIAQKAEILEIRLKIGTGIAGYVAKTGEIINIEDAYNDDRFDPTTDKKTGYHTRSILCMPIFEPLKNESDTPAIIGVLQVLNRIDGVFDKEDEELLASMASQVAIALINARLYASLEKKVSELNLLFDIEQELNKAQSREEMLNWVLKKITDTLLVESAVAALFDGNEDMFSAIISCNIDAKKNEHFKQMYDVPLIAEAVYGGEISVLNDFDQSKTAETDIFKTIGINVRHLVIVPLKFENKTIGVMALFNKKEKNDFFRNEDLQLLKSISGQTARSLETYRLRKEKENAEHLASIGNMMSTIVHDLRTPVNNIQGFVELMQEEDDQEMRDEFAGIVMEQVNTLTSMIKDVLDFAKGKTSILPIKYPVDKLIGQFSKLYEEQIKKKGFEYEAACEAVSMVYVDPEKMGRVFMNIMKNALEAMPAGGKFSIRATEENGEILFSLSDTGSGIPEEIRDKLFDSFVTSGKEGGTGLGLAIVKKVIDQHKGRIEVESEKNKGTTFKIYLKRL